MIEDFASKKEAIENLAYQKRILENQEAILDALSRIVTPMAGKNPKMASVNNELIDCYHATRKMLHKSYVER